MRLILKTVTELVNDEVFFTENKEYVNTGLEKAKELFLGFQKVMEELDYEDDLGFNEALDSFKSDLDDLKPDSTFNMQERSFLTKDSFLVCRCGGIINIVYDNKEITKSFTDIGRNIIELFKWIENDLYGLIYGMEEWETWQMAASFIDAFNFVRYTLLELKETSRFSNYIKGVYNGEKVDGFGVEMDISVQSRSVLNKKSHNKKAALNFLSFGLGALSFEYGTVFSIVTASIMELVDPNSDNLKSIGSSVMSEVKNETVKTGSTLASAFLVLKSLVGAIGEASYSSEADYVGEIKVVIKNGTHDITYARSYDITGKPLNEPESNLLMRKKPYCYFDSSSSSLVSTEVVDLKSFDNIINVDTTLAVDVDKIEKIKKEYSVDEEGINEK